MGNLVEFVRESNRIERIKVTTLREVEAHEAFLDLEVVRVHDLRAFVSVVADARMRNGVGMNVVVGRHRPPSGGPEITERLGELLELANDNARTPYQIHCEYEGLHPFMDGNGRSGRVLWAWQMQHMGRDPFALSFLQHWYYQSLDASRERAGGRARTYGGV